MASWIIFLQLLLQKSIVVAGITVLDHPPYSPDLALADFWLFPVAMKGDRHDTIQDIQRECSAVLNAIPQKEYSDCFQKLSIDCSCVLIQKDTILDKKSDFLKIIIIIYLLQLGLHPVAVVLP
jgi:hypothetical protein